MLRLVVIVAVLVVATLIGRSLAGDGPPTPIAPSSPTGAMLHPREGAMYHQPYTSTR